MSDLCCSLELLAGSELPRIPIPRTRVNKGMSKGRGCTPWPFFFCYRASRIMLVMRWLEYRLAAGPDNIEPHVGVDFVIRAPTAVDNIEKIIVCHDVVVSGTTKDVF